MLHHGIPKHEITQIFYDGLGALDQYLVDAASGGTFMRKYEDEALELIKLVADETILYGRCMHTIWCQNKVLNLPNYD